MSEIKEAQPKLIFGWKQRSVAWEGYEHGRSETTSAVSMLELC